MRNYIPFFIACALIALGACTEIEYRDVEKEVLKHDTITKYVDRVFLGTDTVTITQIVETPTPTRSETDTVYIIQHDTIETIRVDSIFIEKIVYLHDTVVVRKTQYGDTLMITVGRAVFQWPQELEVMINQFYIDAQNHGLNPPGYPMLVEYAEIDPILQAYSYTAYYQRFLKLNASLTTDESYVPLMREMSRLFLGKVYSADPNSVMNPFFPSDRIRWSNRAQYQEELNELFE